MFAIIICTMALAALFLTGCKKPGFKENGPAGGDDALPIKSLSVGPQPAVTIPADLLTKYKPESWMSEVPDNIKISHLSIPGTRWSTYNLPYASGQYQTTSISEQLNMGVRYLQIHCRLNTATTTFVTVRRNDDNHNTVLTQFIDTLNTFLTSNNRETIILMLEETTDWPNPDNWTDKIREVVDANPTRFYKWPNYYSATTTTTADWPRIGDLRGKIMILSHSDRLKQTYFARVMNDLNSQIKLGWTDDGNGVVPAEYVNEHFSSSGETKVTQVHNLCARADGGTNPAADLGRLFLNETGRGVATSSPSLSSTTIGSEADTINPRVDDLFELQFNETWNYGRFGIIAMDRMGEYSSKLIYLTNFDRYNKIFKPYVLGVQYGQYYAGYHVAGSNELGSLYSTWPKGSTFGNFTYPTSVREKFVNANWMYNIPDTTHLNLINIPATHDAVTSGGGPEDKCQNMTVAQQLDNGVRSLDLRLTSIANKPTDELYGHHGPINYEDIKWSDLIETLTDFLDAHPSETIILHTNLGTEDLRLRFNNRIQTAGKAGYFLSSCPPVPTMGQLRKKVWLVRGSDLSNPGCDWTYQGGLDYAANPNTPDIDSKWAKLEQDLIDAQLPQNHQYFWENPSSWTPSPQSAANTINPKLIYKLNEMNSDGTLYKARRLGEVPVDFVSLQIAQAVILSNFTNMKVMNTF